MEKGYPWLIARGFAKILALFIMIFILAGRTDYWQGWVFVAYIVVLFAVMAAFFSKNTDLMRERVSPGPGIKGWDKIFWMLYLPLSIAVFVIAILDSGRFHWTRDLPVYVYIISYVILTFSTAVFLWCMYVNKFFSSVVRIQKDRKQVTITKGPYKFVRHPGYAVAFPMYVSMSLVLGSLYSLIPSVIATILLMARTYLEDETLKKELKGYKEYSKKVKYRLVPGVW